MTALRHPRLAAAMVVVGALGLSACGGGTGKPASPTVPAVSNVPLAPGANIDPNANGTFTGPINRARDVAGDANQRTQQLEQQTATSEP